MMYFCFREYLEEFNNIPDYVFSSLNKELKTPVHTDVGSCLVPVLAR